MIEVLETQDVLETENDFIPGSKCDKMRTNSFYVDILSDQESPVVFGPTGKSPVKP